MPARNVGGDCCAAIAAAPHPSRAAMKRTFGEGTTGLPWRRGNFEIVEDAAGARRVDPAAGDAQLISPGRQLQICGSTHAFPGIRATRARDEFLALRPDNLAVGADRDDAELDF